MFIGTLLFLHARGCVDGSLSWREPPYLPTTTMANEPVFIFPRRSPGAGGSNSAEGRKILWVLESRAMVRALRLVGTFSTTVNLSGESSWTTVRTPSPQEANA